MCGGLLSHCTRPSGRIGVGLPSDGWPFLWQVARRKYEQLDCLICIPQPEDAKEGWKDAIMFKLKSAGFPGEESFQRALQSFQATGISGLQARVSHKLTMVNLTDALREVIGTLKSQGNVTLVREASLIAVCSDIPSALLPRAKTTSLNATI
ncbi:hypothetical protein BDV06DRAFT_204917 [Aspergillus oleicola]